MEPGTSGYSCVSLVPDCGKMTKDEFQIGHMFYTPAGEFLCTDIGTRVIVAIKLDQKDDSWYNGPPYAVAEHVFDEYGMPGCYLEPVSAEPPEKAN